VANEPVGAASNGHPAPTEPLRHDVSGAQVASLVVAMLIAIVSTAGLVWGNDGRYSESHSVLVSQGADAANLLLAPLLLGLILLVRRRSMIGLLLWPGLLFYALYACMPYLVDAPFSLVLFGYVALATLCAFTIIGIVAGIDGPEVRHRLAGAPARWTGGALVGIGLLAYAGLAANAVNMIGDPASLAGMRGHWIADWALGTPVLLVGGVLLLRHASLGYVVAPGLLFVSGIGAVVFAVAAILDNLLGDLETEPATIAIHLAIGAFSFALLAFFLIRAAGRRPVIQAESRSAS
jgi:hypothetical protein